MQLPNTSGGCAGIGRTGTFCTVDIALRRLRCADLRNPQEVKAAVSIKRIVAALRRQRPGMVQTFDQYLLCYQVSHWRRIMSCMLSPPSILTPTWWQLSALHLQHSQGVA